jgi:hypothetical protein
MGWWQRGSGPTGVPILPIGSSETVTSHTRRVGVRGIDSKLRSDTWRYRRIINASAQPRRIVQAPPHRQATASRPSRSQSITRSLPRLRFVFRMVGDASCLVAAQRDASARACARSEIVPVLCPFSPKPRRRSPQPCVVPAQRCPACSQVSGPPRRNRLTRRWCSGRTQSGSCGGRATSQLTRTHLLERECERAHLLRIFASRSIFDASRLSLTPATCPCICPSPTCAACRDSTVPGASEHDITVSWSTPRIPCSASRNSNLAPGTISMRTSHAGTACVARMFRVVRKWEWRQRLCTRSCARCAITRRAARGRARESLERERG